MDETKKQTVEMTAEDAAHFAAFNVEQENKSFFLYCKENSQM